jgi:tRNA A37 threonylcarbamoyladenosine modification protein TsaB
VGLAAVKGFAEVLDAKVVGISMLAAQASVVDANHVLALLDAQRNEVFAGEYRDGHCVQERLLTREETANWATGSSIRAITPDATLSAIANVEVVRRATSEDVLRVALPGFELPGTDIEQLDANYIRRSDAEMNWKS